MRNNITHSLLFSLLTILFVILNVNSYAQLHKSIPIQSNEFWYGVAVNEGEKMPFDVGYSMDLLSNVEGNQATPLLISNKGRYIWCDKPFAFRVEEKAIKIYNNSVPIIIDKNGKSLRSAYLAAAKRFFPANGKLPDSLLFSSPQYNTWIELTYNQNQKDILKYARDIINNGLPPGVLMIDDNWAPYYGKFEFRKDRFSEAKAMIEELHQLGFKVMLWVCPFIRPDSEEARFLMSKKWVIMDNEDKIGNNWAMSTKPKLVQWWNGFSMVMDFTNPQAVEWFQQQLNFLTSEYKVDGFKFDAGDPQYYTNALSFKKVLPNEHTELWGVFGLQYPLNEYRAMWKRGGEALGERLRDKRHSWEDLQKLIPDITGAGLLGYPFTCPDMIGGGDYISFLDSASTRLDQDLIVRSAQCHALMPMMQFSVAPWRVLDSTHFYAVKKSVKIRERFTPEIMALANNAAKSGEPIVSNMEYVFPAEGFERCKDQFMLGTKILVAPILNKNSSRKVRLPKGKWIDSRGDIIQGSKTYIYNVALDELLWFRLI